MPLPSSRLVSVLALAAVTALAPAAACAQHQTAADAPGHGLSQRPQPTLQPSPASTVPRPDHVVVVVFENKKAGSIIGNPDAPYFNELADGGAYMAQSYGVAHPSQPNYIALFSGSTHGVANDNCGYSFKANNQAHEMLKAGHTFVSYAEDLPQAGSQVCSAGGYARKHAPWTDFPNVPAKVQQPYTSFPSDYSSLPDVSWVIPNLCDDMHDCSIATGDSWLQSHLGDYATWAMTHNSLLIVTFDEDDYTGANQIATIFYGEQVAPGSYDERITHYSVLRTMEDMYGVPHLLKAKKAKSITDIWKS